MKFLSLIIAFVFISTSVEAMFFSTLFGCRRPRRPRFGKIVPDRSNYNFGRSITYECDRGFNINIKNNKQTCLITRKFTPSRTITCSDINECQRNPCRNANCRNSQGSFSCLCNKGYRRVTSTRCEDIDECRGSNDCHEDANCSNTRGSFVCRCKNGFIGDGKLCVPRPICRGGYSYTRYFDRDQPSGREDNEGYDNLVRENPGEICANPVSIHARIVGTTTDYRLSGQTIIAETEEEKGLICLNRENSEGCRDYEIRFCCDIDECENNPCHEQATCTNMDGSFTCACNTGYEGSGLNCTNTDECATNPCHAQASCMDTDGSFTCTCNAGYEGDGLSCTKIDPCDPSPCDKEAFCSVFRNVVRCNCKRGYNGDGFTCTKDPGCTPSPCDENADCSVLFSRHQCECRPGFVGNGKTCTEDPLCNPSPCHAKADCTVRFGRRQCTCQSGYVGDGMTCTKVFACPSPPDVPNGAHGQHFGPYRPGDALSVICNQNYIIVPTFGVGFGFGIKPISLEGLRGGGSGSNYRCNVNGEWEGTFPQCLGTCVGNCGSTDPSLPCSCEDGCTGSHCCGDYRDQCTPSTCRPPRAIDHGQIRSQVPYNNGDELVLKCDQHYRREPEIVQREPSFFHVPDRNAYTCSSFRGVEGAFRGPFPTCVASCKDVCSNGKRTNKEPNHTCKCDSNCKQRDDCCSDYDALCTGRSTANFPGQLS